MDPASLVKMRACGICGSDGFYISIGGIPPRQGETPLGHEPAGEVVEVGADVEGIAIGDHVVVNPIASRKGMIGSGGPGGALSEFLGIPRDLRGHPRPDRRVGEVRADHQRPVRFADVEEALALATTPGAADKVVVTFAG